ncbi:metal-dependent protein hydrolase domain-containing protein [Cavenderia fasciculata]|uniref:Metal-dependent protein hydrolase domain-containing protein n=1 Tax=Cavenderia fasciculata TaxID=261658 RepID=F4PQ13_CACFS|nr:metal-dependent protein hydrolase domain-containing protein [Cavenderia fasciculata]EGG22476.1 metal-dependent protein hydrolase domain-containing protein [Cavenderia fasciculata]|eukprot:XP_004360327.1 metal-dependent protein hydrolase domain-containing protein [Cavenderia fasciculata]
MKRLHSQLDSNSNNIMSQLTICTHSGSFHADEALACFLLKLTDQFKDAKIIRSRDTEVVKAADVAVDVGAEYNQSKHRYDHHQAGFTEIFGDGFKTKLSSAGLIYKHFGKEIIKNRLQLDERKVNLIYKKVYANAIEELDGMDNGIERYPIDVKPLYAVTSTIGNRVASLNPSWNEPQDDDILFKQFEKAMTMMGEYFLDKVDYYGKSWVPAYDIVETAVKNRSSVHSSGEIIILDQYCPWKDHLYHVEDVLSIQTKIKFVLYQDTLGSWRIQAVNLDSHSFALRKALLEAWRGKRDQELSDIIDANGFIGGHKTKEGALTMAIKSL